MDYEVPVLKQSKWLRFLTLCLLYVAQGLPIGLFQVALPAWFASEGMSAGEVGGFIAIVFLPWSFKLFAGPVMDRFSFPAMGRRRPWVIVAQLGIILSFALLAVVSPDPNESYYLLAGLGFCCNFFGALQDVAVDGMAIDILEEEERGQANAYMFGGQAGGMALAASVGSAALVNFGLSIAALLMAITVFLIMLLPVFLREREGERVFPWSDGEPSPEALASVSKSWSAIILGLIRNLILPMSLLLMLLEAVQRLAAGMIVAINPVITVQTLGWAQTDYTSWVALAGVIGAVVGVVFGPLIDRIGTYRILGWAIGFRMVLFGAFGLGETYWQTVEVYEAMLMANYISSQFVTITIISLFMRICSKTVAATQFAVYMASANLTLSMGSAMVAPLSSFLSYSQMFLFASGLSLFFLLLLPFFKIERHDDDLSRLSG
jgi:PAT family beta-lactamase induction signal transducer AmpG